MVGGGPVSKESLPRAAVLSGDERVTLFAMSFFMDGVIERCVSF